MWLLKTINLLVLGKRLSSKSNHNQCRQSSYSHPNSNASNVGIVPGIFLNGWLAAKYGYRKVIIVALFFLNAFIFITFFAPNKPVLVVGQILCGFSWGVFATIGPAYASEIVPLQLRGYLTSYVNLCCE
jgi:SP family general alpha glucoside:H+ symporter-like MFS transporter